MDLIRVMDCGDLRDEMGIAVVLFKMSLHSFSVERLILYLMGLDTFNHVVERRDILAYQSCFGNSDAKLSSLSPDEYGYCGVQCTPGVGWFHQQKRCLWLVLCCDGYLLWW